MSSPSGSSNSGIRANHDGPPGRPADLNDELSGQIRNILTYRIRNLKRSFQSICYVVLSIVNTWLPIEEPSSSNMDEVYDYEFTNGIPTVFRYPNGMKTPIPFFYESKQFLEEMEVIETVGKNVDLITHCTLKRDILIRDLKGHKALLEGKPIENSERCFLSVQKVDTHLHAAAIMCAQGVLHFLRSLILQPSKAMVPKSLCRDNELTTLEEELIRRNIDVSGIRAPTIEVELKMRPPVTVALRSDFSGFKELFYPFGDKDLKNLLFKYDNCIEGAYYASIINTITEDMLALNQMAEIRISLNGESADQWLTLANWFQSKITDRKNTLWMVQISKNFVTLLDKKVNVKNFGDFLSNFFEPLFKCSIQPKSADNPLADLLSKITGFDLVDEELENENYRKDFETLPHKWVDRANPSQVYYSYYFYRLITELNFLRKANGLNVYSFRPHTGERNNGNNLAASFLLAESVSHGTFLDYHPVLEQLYFLAQVGISCSPNSNHFLCRDYHKLPFADLLYQGHRITLTTDDPYLFCKSNDPLNKEYSDFLKFPDISEFDLCEFARNSVLISGMDKNAKSLYISPESCIGDVDYEFKNDEKKTNVPNTRVEYRLKTLSRELQLYT